MTQQERETLIADFVLGTLDGAALIEAERLMLTDAAFARDVEQWRVRLADFDRTAEVMTPPESLWSTIERDIARPVASSTSPGLFAGLWNSLPAWRAIGLAAAATAVALTVGLGFAMREAQRTPQMIAILVDGDKAGAIVHVFNDGRATLLPLADMPIPADRSLQVWTLPSRERGPVSVGLMEQARTLALSLKDVPAPGANQLFEITIEPKGGSPTGRPTGPILFKGLTAPTI
ncbi:MAG: anti-sigma factor [Pseudolabrys sp.]|nr:anti-sigma factor [Pseudolabrys sp.]